MLFRLAVPVLGSSLAAIIDLTRQFGRYGFRMITGWLYYVRWHVNYKLVVRIWLQEGLKVPRKKAKWGRPLLNDGSWFRLRPELPDHVWSHDFVQDRTHDGSVVRTLSIIDEFTKNLLVILARRKRNSTDVVDALPDLVILRGACRCISSANGFEFMAEKVPALISSMGAATAFIEPDSPWGNGHGQSHNAGHRDELCSGEVIYTLREAQILTGRWRRHYNSVRPHCALGYDPPAPETIVPMNPRPAVDQHSNRTSRWGPENTILGHKLFPRRRALVSSTKDFVLACG